MHSSDDSFNRSGYVLVNNVYQNMFVLAGVTTLFFLLWSGWFWAYKFQLTIETNNIEWDGSRAVTAIYPYQKVNRIRIGQAVVLMGELDDGQSKMKVIELKAIVQSVTNDLENGSYSVELLPETDLKNFPLEMIRWQKAIIVSGEITPFRLILQTTGQGVDTPALPLYENHWRQTR